MQLSRIILNSDERSTGQVYDATFDLQEVESTNGRYMVGVESFVGKYDRMVPTPLTTLPNSCLGIAYSPSLDLFVTCGQASQISTSSNGYTWTTRTPPVSGMAYTRVVWSPALSIFCMCASSGVNPRIATSPDGINWTARTASARGYQDIAWSNTLGLFCIVASDGAALGSIVTSPDGITWTDQTPPVTKPWQGVVWAFNKFYVMTWQTSGGNHVLSSSDGVNWAAETGATAFDIAYLKGTYSPELNRMVLIGDGPLNTSLRGAVYDGTTWTRIDLIEQNSWRDVFWSSSFGLFIAVGETGVYRMATSPDGINWTLRKLYDNILLRAVGGGPGVVVAQTSTSFNGGRRSIAFRYTNMDKDFIYLRMPCASTSTASKDKVSDVIATIAGKSYKNQYCTPSTMAVYLDESFYNSKTISLQLATTLDYITPLNCMYGLAGNYTLTLVMWKV